MYSPVLDIPMRPKSPGQRSQTFARTNSSNSALCIADFTYSVLSLSKAVLASQAAPGQTFRVGFSEQVSRLSVRIQQPVQFSIVRTASGEG
jgi:hypothetical protein